MGHIDLRDLDDDDLDAIFGMMRDPQSVERAAFTAVDPADRRAFDEWMLRQRSDDTVLLFTVTEDGVFVGTTASFQIDGEREITVWIARHAWGRGVGSAAVRLLIAREAERPLYARVSAGNAASLALVAKLGFAEVSRTTSFAPGLGRSTDEIVFALPPTLE